jgi:hypothetical protein
METTILDFELKRSLFDLCGFSLSEKWNLLYRASLHGFRAHNFHEKCDHIARTLTVIKVTSGNIFGGYTEAMWNQSGEYKADKSAFIFSLVNKEKKPLKMSIGKENYGYAIKSSPKQGPTFGAGHDICIVDKANKSDLNYSNLVFSYDIDQHEFFSKNKWLSKSFMAGAFYLMVEDIEVFYR